MDDRTDTRRSFREALDRLTQEILAMGVLVEESVRRALDGMAQGNLDTARRVIADDGAIDRMQTAIEDMAVALVATEQPVATDLRRLVTGLKIVTQLERMGDHAVHLAKATMVLADLGVVDIPPQVQEMGGLGHTMLREALRAMVDNDAGRTIALAEMDSQVDALYARLMETLSARMKSSPDLVDSSLQLVHVARYLERLGDHATNIGEWVVYGETARHVALNP